METAPKQPVYRNNIPYLVTLIVFIIVCLSSITFVVVFGPEQDRIALVTQIFGFMATVTVAMMAFITSREGTSLSHETKTLQIQTKDKQDVILHTVDGRMTEIMNIMRELGLAKAELELERGLREGAETGRKDEVKRVEGVEQGHAAGVQQAEDAAQAKRDDTPGQVTLK